MDGVPGRIDDLNERVSKKTEEWGVFWSGLPEGEEYQERSRQRLKFGEMALPGPTF